MIVLFGGLWTYLRYGHVPVAVADALSLATGVGVLAWQRFAMARLAGLALARFWRGEPAMRYGPMRPRRYSWWRG